MPFVSQPVYTYKIIMNVQEGDALAIISASVTKMFSMEIVCTSLIFVAFFMLVLVFCDYFIKKYVRVYF